MLPKTVPTETSRPLACQKRIQPVSHRAVRRPTEKLFNIATVHNLCFDPLRISSANSDNVSIVVCFDNLYWSSRQPDAYTITM